MVDTATGQGADWYGRTYAGWMADPKGFWAEASTAVTWSTPWTQVLDDSDKPLYRWFVGGELNTCYNVIDRHVEAGRGDQPALIHDSAMTGVVRQFTYAELQTEVARVAGAFRALGVGKGDRVVIYMPMVPEAVFAMLACARLGAVHSVVFGGFADKELAKRVDDAKPVLVVTASCGLEAGRVVEYKPILDSALDIAEHKPAHCLMLQRPQCTASMVAPRDVDWQAVMATAEPAACVPVAATDPLYILYTSGSTGVPKGVVRDNGGHLTALLWSMEHIYGVKAGDVFWAASDIGWVVGHSYIVYAPLAAGCTTIMYEGKPVGTPDAGAFWRVIEQHKVKVLFVAPTAFRAIKKEDPTASLLAKYDISSLETLFLAGERADPETVKWAQATVKVPVIDHWWQTELGWPGAANFAGSRLMPVKIGSAGLPVPGYEIHILSPASEVLEPNQTGDVAIKLPLPPGALPTLWNNAEGYKKTYLVDHPGYYMTGDAGFIDDDGYLHFMSRTDDIINVAGHRLATGAMEEVVATHPSVAECAVIGVADEVKGMVPMAFVVLYASEIRSKTDIEREVVKKVRDTIGPVAALKMVLPVKALPKTRSGKILRKTMRQIADGEPYQVPATIDDPAVLAEIRRTLHEHGFDVRHPD
ncbi:propionyl-CoA synthetase [Parapedomonas caeni]